MVPSRKLGAAMRADITEGIDRPQLDALSAVADLGPWHSTVLFVGTDAAANARTVLHYDQVDNLYLQARSGPAVGGGARTSQAPRRDRSASPRLTHSCCR